MSHSATSRSGLNEEKAAAVGVRGSRRVAGPGKGPKAPQKQKKKMRSPTSFVDGAVPIEIASMVSGNYESFFMHLS